MGMACRAVNEGIYLFINAVFLVKYSAPITAHPYTLALLYTLIVPFLLRQAKRLPEKLFTKKMFLGLALLYGCFWVVLLALVPADSFTLDRQEMIRLFWDNFFTGINPYTPRTPGSNIPGPFPFYFYLALPFFLIQEIGYFSLTGIIVFLLTLQRHTNNERERILILLALVLSPAAAYEILCRSTLFLNSALVLLYVYTVRRVDLDKTRNLCLSALVFGLLLSTRSIVLVLLLPFLLFLGLHRKGIGSLLLWGAWSAAGVTVTFLPVMFFPGFFPANNPIAVQNIFLPSWIPALALLGMCFLAARRRVLYVLVTGSGVTIFLLVCLHIALVMNSYGFYATIFQDGADITYLTLSLPFALLGLSGGKRPSDPLLRQTETGMDR